MGTVTLAAVFATSGALGVFDTAEVFTAGVFPAFCFVAAAEIFVGPEAFGAVGDFASAAALAATFGATGETFFADDVVRPAPTDDLLLIAARLAFALLEAADDDFADAVLVDEVLVDEVLDVAVLGVAVFDTEVFGAPVLAAATLLALPFKGARAVEAAARVAPDLRFADSAMLFAFVVVFRDSVVLA